MDFGEDFSAIDTLRNIPAYFSRFFRDMPRDLREYVRSYGDYGFSADHSGGFGGELRLAVGFRF